MTLKSFPGWDPKWETFPSPQSEDKFVLSYLHFFHEPSPCYKECVFMKQLVGGKWLFIFSFKIATEYAIFL